MTFKVILVVGNTHTKQRDSGYSVVLNKPCASRHRTGKTAMDSQDEVTGKLYDSGVYVSRHLSLRLYRKAFNQKISNRAETRTGFGKPDCPGSQGGLRKRELWLRLNGHVTWKR
jgi:hypothetical protein